MTILVLISFCVVIKANPYLSPLGNEVHSLEFELRGLYDSLQKDKPWHRDVLLGHEREYIKEIRAKLRRLFDAVHDNSIQHSFTYIYDVRTVLSDISLLKHVSRGTGRLVAMIRYSVLLAEGLYTLAVSWHYSEGEGHEFYVKDRKFAHLCIAAAQMGKMLMATGASRERLDAVIAWLHPLRRHEVNESGFAPILLDEKEMLREKLCSTPEQHILCGNLDIIEIPA